jgi:hypothetical protein
LDIAASLKFCNLIFSIFRLKDQVPVVSPDIEEWQVYQGGDVVLVVRILR